MKKNAINFLRAAFPFITVLFLWRLAMPFWNPAGILALIPIFYCSFVRPVPWFGAYSILFCFLIDYKSAAVLYWTAIYCLVYSINGFQTVIDLTHMDKNAIGAFLIVFFVAALILVISNFSIYNLGTAMWLTLWMGILYIPITTLIKRCAK